jgi:hypothetical protein
MQPSWLGGYVRRVLIVVLSFWFLSPTSVFALVFSSPDSEPQDERPPDFPYWENITQRRYEGPSVIYLGAGWVLTARHVGIGEVLLEGESFMPNMRSRHILLNTNGTAADAIVFQLDPDTDLPDLPILPLATVAPLPGEEVMLIGFGRGREKVIEWHNGGRTRFGFEWSKRGSKRWGTNRINAGRSILVQDNMSTHAITFVFDRPSSANTTRYEAQAALGDSGGAVFVRRDDEWLLVGMMTSVSSIQSTSGDATASTYGDTTFAADISFYRNEILRWARPKCVNEEDDDGDGKIDFPLDPGCSAPGDPDERDTSLLDHGTGAFWAITLGGGFVLGVLMSLRLRQRNQS